VTIRPVPRDGPASAILAVPSGAYSNIRSMAAPADPYSYAWLLGFYLGDGCVSRTTRTYQLRIVLDRAYPEVIDDCVTAVMLGVLPRSVYVRPKRDSRAAVVEASSKRLPELFPQHGPGRKHKRAIVLAGWQRAIVDAHPQPFLRGLIHSDGCRTVTRFKTRLPSGRIAEYEYPRYFFSNLSADIRRLFCEYCERLGIRWTQSNHRNISVSHRRSVAILDGFIGPKT
jgi:hypothetical protein